MQYYKKMLKIFNEIYLRLDEDAPKQFLFIITAYIFPFLQEDSHVEYQNITGVINIIHDSYLNDRRFFALNIFEEKIEEEFKNKMFKYISYLNGYLAYCDENRESILRNESMGDLEKYLYSFIELLIYEDIHSPIFIKYMKKGEEKRYLFY